ncbi:MAG: hypothetical protein A2149_05105 [Candidatus Schekmanbacteria bacterium RBG_16_38_11]|uniref:L-2-amino-thiazoline-4-carboxylic acid hydrolase n=1 Tax=Candidatus Schekmanbacteria bacterium RBG_16_38_11 TaxID=1817880 RepID=A0A1F7S166_9BACT|nr:MAG: hypothetical protein A2149_05105 [Candidatus Schekmanbacteria bacterium RBG_16_38_11]
MLDITKQRDILLERFALYLPELYENLKRSLGKEKGVEIFKKVAEEKFKKSYEKIKNIPLDKLMKAEDSSSQIFGWKLWIEEREEEGRKVWYEYLANCPHLAATKKYNIPAPCEPVCYMDFELLEKYGILKAKKVAHVLEGAEACCFKITAVK